GEWLGLPIDAGMPGEPGFWLGRAGWIALCLLVVAPLVALVVGFELRRKREVPPVGGTGAVLLGGLVLYAGLGTALVWGVWPGALVGLAAVGFASWWRREHVRA